MKPYDEFIESSLALLEGQPGHRLTVPGADETWPDAGEYNLILRSEMAYELGGGNLPAVSGLGFTSSDRLVGGDELWLYGPDLPDLQKDAPYARLTLLRVAKDSLGEDDVAYAAIRKIEHTRYHIIPKGYMTRISAASEREPVRVSRKALQEGLDFAKVGGLFLRGYHQHSKVLAAKLIFITLPDFPYDELEKKAHKAEKITMTLDHIFKNLKMDCSTCNLKQVCDEVEEMRELHFAQDKRKQT
ncbi:carbon monoxide dehydrogenase [Clostridium gasigenes]|uniref:carbon monoxide dehydrogenase n=1 Tax=Clostridium gasigenes TaxID=94869 RepID=UPI0016291F4D|nr:carbon monoxide dehydrogenase [Clostridium gasigenes]MBB6623332.1 carbon monoxide dehydrogenase [Clostridium gasigenes]MBU3088043.1 carbon monoxide dehydrogenase [Clostridium gasigenes]